MGVQATIYNVVVSVFMSDTWLQNYSAAALPPSTGGKIHADNGHLVAFRPSIRMHQMISGHQQSARLSPPSLSMCHGKVSGVQGSPSAVLSDVVCDYGPVGL